MYALLNNLLLHKTMYFINMHINEIMLLSSILLLSAVVFNKIGGKFGVPSLILFIFVGILAGSDGILGIRFEDYILAQNIGILAINYILFMGGLSVDIDEVKPVFKEGFSLATAGVIITALIAGGCSYLVLDLSVMECLLLGAIISSTDAAAVFSVLRSKGISLHDNLKPLLEFESGSNDPMAVFLTLAAIGLITNQLSVPSLIVSFLVQMTLGIALGYGLGRLTSVLINKIKIEPASLYVVITIASVLFTYSFTTMAGGNGFMAVYVAGLTMSSLKFAHKNMLAKFHDATAWLMQIVMFMILGLLVNFKEGAAFTLQALYVALILIFIARPSAVFITELFFKRELNDKLMISWVGLRGAAPIVLATFPLTENIPYAKEIFNIVFFVVLISVLLQGTTIPFIAKKLNVDAPINVDYNSILEYEVLNTNNKMIEFTVPAHSPCIGKQIFELNLPLKTIVSLVYKNGEYIIPTASTIVEANDVLFVLLDIANECIVRDIICKPEKD